MPSASSSAHCAARLVARRDRWEARPYGRPVAVDGRRAGRAVAAAEQVRAEDAEPIRVQRSARTDERLPPVAGCVRRAGQGMDDDDLRRRPRSAVRRGDRRRPGPAGPSRRPARSDPSDALSSRPVPVAGGRAGRRPGRASTSSSPGRADQLAVSRSVRGGRGERLARGRRSGRRHAPGRPTGGRGRRSPRSGLLLRTRAASGSWRPGG